MNDENTVELKDIVTMCKLTKLEVESDKSDEDYSPESETELLSDLDDKRRRLNREANLFDPEKQTTQYNTKPLPKNTPIVEINEKPSENSKST